VKTSILSLAEALGRGPPPAGNLAIPIQLDADLEVEIYAPPGQDPQKPHDRDEVYIVARGTATFLDGSNRHSVTTGAYLFVAAHQLHRFEEISDDFAVWVFFFGPVRPKSGA
jgi:hypothetical protein